MVAAAVIGAAVIGGVASNQAAKKSAGAGKAGINANNALAARSRQDAMNLFSQGRDSAHHRGNRLRRRHLLRDAI